MGSELPAREPVRTTCRDRSPRPLMHPPIRISSGILSLLAAGALATTLSGGPLQPAPAVASPPAVSLAATPLYFVENRGQSDPGVAYYTQGSDAEVYFTRPGITFVLNAGVAAIGVAGPVATPEPIPAQASTRRWTIKIDFVGANPSPVIEGVDLTSCTFNYFQGRPSEWETGVPSFLGVRYRDLWPGIDLVYYGSGPSLKYDFIVRPGADPNDIQLRYRGSQGTEIDDRGRLLVRNPIRTLVDEAPTAYAEQGADRSPVSAGYQVRRIPAKREGAVLRESAAILSFRIGEYDSSRTLVIDPAVLLYCGYIGGTMTDAARAVAVDGQGSAYVSGMTFSSGAEGFPANAGPNLTSGGRSDAFVAKVQPGGTGFVYCGYIGGTQGEIGYGIAVDAAGAAYVTGYTGSTEANGFPIVAGPDGTYNGLVRDAFVTKVADTASADLSITKTDAPDPVSVGSNLIYTITVTNNGPDAATNVTVVDTLTASVSFVSATASQGSCSGTTTVTCNLGGIANGANATVTIAVTPGTAGTLNNTATVSATETDPNAANNSATASTTVAGVDADLAVSVSAIPNPVSVNGTLSYSVQVVNNGPLNATGVTVTTNLSGSSFNIVSITPSQGSCIGTTAATCSLGAVANGASAAVNVVVTPTAVGSVTLSAAVGATQPDGTAGNNNAVLSVNAVNTVCSNSVQAFVANVISPQAAGCSATVGPTPSGGGGGSLGWVTLLGLVFLGLARRRIR